MFAYCNNNPVNDVDLGGTRPVPVEVDDEPIFTPINGQNLEPFVDMAYGVSTIGYSGCEAIAVYNFMLLIGKPHSFSSVVSFMQSRFDSVFLSGWGKKGEWGATPGDIRAYLDCEGVKYHEASGLLWMDTFYASPGTYIISYWNEDLLNYGYHTIAVSYDGSTYLGYNQDTYSKDPVPGTKLGDFMADDWRFIYGYYVPNA